MLVWIINLIFGIVSFALNIAGWLVFVYVLMLLIIPRNKYTLLVGKYMEMALTPVRGLLSRIFPKIAKTGIDFAPAALIVIIVVAQWLLGLLQRILV